MFEGAIAYNPTVADATNDASDERWYTTQGLTTSAVTDMSNMFKGATTFNKSLMRDFLDTITTVDTANVWKTDLVTAMTSMFEGAEAFVGTGITNWETNALLNTQSMFKNAKQFNTLIATAGDPIWKVEAITDMSSMFEDAERFAQDL